jgi:hypothetical protein
MMLSTYSWIGFICHVVLSSKCFFITRLLQRVLPVQTNSSNSVAIVVNNPYVILLVHTFDAGHKISNQGDNTGGMVTLRTPYS